MLTWVMFLKFLDDLEMQREQEAPLARKKFRPAIEPPYRWRDWAANPQGMTGMGNPSALRNAWRAIFERRDARVVPGQQRLHPEQMLIHRVEPMVHRIEAVVHGVDPLVGPTEPFG